MQRRNPLFEGFLGSFSVVVLFLFSWLFYLSEGRALDGVLPCGAAWNADKPKINILSMRFL